MNVTLSTTASDRSRKTGGVALLPGSVNNGLSIMRSELARAAELLRHSDPEKVDEALRLLQNTVFSFSMKVCGHREDAEETAQDVLMKSVRHLVKIESPSAMAVWLYKVARNHCWMSRRRSTFAPQETLSLDDLMPDATELGSLTSSAQEGAEHRVLREENADLLREAVLRIPPKYRLVLVLHDMEELETGEVAKIVGLSENNVRVRLHRARLFVRKELAKGRVPGVEGKAGARSKPANCREMFANLSEYIDRRIDDVTCKRMAKHLDDCVPCKAFVKDLERAVQRCRQYEVSGSAGHSEHVRNLLKQEYLRLLAQTDPRF